MIPFQAQLGGVLLQGPGIDLADGNPSGMGSPSILVLILAVIGALAIVALIVIGAKWFRANVSSSVAPAPVDPIDKQTRKRIKDAISEGDHETAGDLYMRIQSARNAAEQYTRGGASLKAARAFESIGNRAQAIHHFKKAGEYALAAALYAKNEDYRSAAAEYVQAESFEEAAKYYALAGDNKRAGEYYDRVGDDLQAAVHYDEDNESDLAADSYAAYIKKQLTHHPDGLTGDDLIHAKRAAELYTELERLSVAAELYESTGFDLEAAECFESLGDVERAYELFVKSGDSDRAAKVLEASGDASRAAIMRAEQAYKTGEFEVAAEEFFKAEMWDKAAQLFEDAELWVRAGEAYENSENFAQATKMFERGSEPARAAHVAEIDGNFVKAAELYRLADNVDGRLRMLEALGDYFEAGRLLFELREFSRALRVLERIESRSPLYNKSLELQGDVIRAQGRFEKAYSRYRSALGTRSADTSTIGLFYKMARVLEEIKDYNGAAQNYDLVVGVDSGFEDAELRLKALKDRQRRTKTSSSGIFSGAEVDGEARRYDVLSEVARGGMGIVYKAKDTVLGRVVAYKVLGENLRENATAVKYFLREARAAAALSHTNIVTIFDAGEQDGEYYMAMEFVEGTTLKELVKRTGSLPNAQVEYIMINCCRALDYAHSKGVIHRDIKSGNVMITRERTLKVMDFGLAKFLKEYQNNHTQQVGTPFYMSPEQIIGKHIDFRSDLYSLGCMLFECATGSVPFFKGDLSYHHIHTQPPSPRSINADLSPKLETMILKLLEKDPDNRYQSAADVITSHAAMSS